VLVEKDEERTTSASANPATGNNKLEAVHIEPKVLQKRKEEMPVGGGRTMGETF